MVKSIIFCLFVLLILRLNVPVNNCTEPTLRGFNQYLVRIYSLDGPGVVKIKDRVNPFFFFFLPYFVIYFHIF